MNQHRHASSLLTLSSLAIGLLLSACCCPPEKSSPRRAEGFPTKGAEAAKNCKPPPKDRAFYMATPQIQQDIHELLSRVPSATPREWGSLARKLSLYGEPAVPPLVASLREQSGERIHIMAAFVLGMIKDPRSLTALNEARFNPSERVRFEAATSMLRMGDHRGLETMIGGLENADPLVRARSILVLEERTSETFGYRADARPGDRAAAVSRWRAWLAQTHGVRQG